MLFSSDICVDLLAEHHNVPLALRAGKLGEHIGVYWVMFWAEPEALETKNYRINDHFIQKYQNNW